MFHPWARRIIEHCLAGGMAGPALGATGANLLHGGTEIPAETLEHWLEQALSAPQPPLPTASGPAYQAPLPGSGDALTAQIAPLLIDHPGDQGWAMAQTAGAARLWPHVASSERDEFRARLLDALFANANYWKDHPATLTREQLRIWNRQLPTMYLSEAHDISELARLPTAPGAKEAFLVVAAHLGNDQAALTHILGTLAAQTAVIGDDSGMAAHALIGTAWFHDHLPAVPPEVIATLLAQVAHQIWWAARHPRSKATSRITAARGARESIHQPASWWAAIGRHPAAPGHAALIAAVALRARTRSISPEDAAALAATFTG